MQCASLIKKREGEKGGEGIDWGHYVTSCFDQFYEGEKNCQQELISRVVKANFKIAENLFQNDHKKSIKMEEKDRIFELKEKYLEESFGWLISCLSNIFYGR